MIRIVGPKRAKPLASTSMGVIVVLVVIILALLLAGALVGLAFELLWLALTGLIIGGLGRLVLPGRQQIGLLQTALVGVAASLLGGLLADVFDAGWIVRLLVAVALAAIGVTLLESRSGTASPRTPA
jgi:uncharacterized membrane protein YeaQ/YmgE (transglycosylase-associated protein family)